MRSALREVHAVSPSAGKAKIAAALGGWLAWASDPNPGRRASATAAANYIDVVNICAQWHAGSSLSFRTWEEKAVVRYSATDAVDALVRVVLGDSAGHIWGRLIYWDGPALSIGAAEMVASPAVEVLDAHYGPSTVLGVEVWQCRTQEAHTVAAPRARAMRATVAAHVAGM